jgi:hypothetical protein
MLRSAMLPREVPPPIESLRVLDGILNEVQQFSQGEQADDMTLIVAKGR